MLDVLVALMLRKVEPLCSAVEARAKYKRQDGAAKFHEGETKAAIELENLDAGKIHASQT